MSYAQLLQQDIELGGVISVQSDKQVTIQPQQVTPELVYTPVYAPIVQIQNHTPAVITAVVYQQPPAQPTGQWRDSLCDCCSNLWPSCCFAMGWFPLPICLAGQISSKIGWLSTKQWLLRYVILSVLCLSVYNFALYSSPNPDPANLSPGILFLPYVPGFWLLIFLIILRYKFVAHFNLREGSVDTCCIGYWCTLCSLCQMSRHLFKYNRVFDGDCRLDGSINYDESA